MDQKVCVRGVLQALRVNWTLRSSFESGPASGEQAFEYFSIVFLVIDRTLPQTIKYITYPFMVYTKSHWLLNLFWQIRK